MTAQPNPKSDEPLVLCQDADGIRTITLNRPAARNALSVGLMAALQDELDRVAADTSVKVVIVAANGPAFCAGHDLKEIRANKGRAYFESVFSQCSKLMTSVVRLPKPVIAKVHATATAAGCQLIASCDLVVASKASKFATPGVNIGLFCSTPMVALSRAVGRKHAMEMLLTGDLIDAERAYEMGLVNRVVAPGDLDATTDALARQIAAKSPLTLAIGKEAFYRQLELGLDDAYNYASETMVRNMLARDAEEGIDAFIQKRDPKWEGR